MSSIIRIEKLNRILNRILKLILLNFLWIGGVLVGLIVFGLGPSTLAVLHVIRDWFRGNDDLPIFITFVQYFKNYLKEGTLLMFIYSVLGIILVVDLIYASTLVVKVFFGVMLFLYALSIVYVFPINVHYDLKTIKERIKYSFLIGFSYMQYSLVLFVVIISIVFLVAYFFPALFTLYGISFPLFMIMWNAMNVFNIIEKGVAEEVNNESKRMEVNQSSQN